MSTISTNAWVIHRGDSAIVPGKLVRETYSFDEPGPDEVVAKPLYGCWEGNMNHVIRRSSIDICARRRHVHRVLQRHAPRARAARDQLGI